MKATAQKEPTRSRGDFRIGEIVRVTAKAVALFRKTYGEHLSASSQLRVAYVVPRGTYGTRRAYLCEARPGEHDAGKSLPFWGDQLELVAEKSVKEPWKGEKQA